MLPRNAYKLGKLPDGTPVARYTVHYCSTAIMSRDLDYIEGTVSVLSAGPREAMQHVLESGDWRQPVEVKTWGPKGGEYRAFWGFETVIGHQMLQRRAEARQMPLTGRG